MRIRESNLFSIVTLLDTKSLEKVTREIDGIDLAKALKNEDNATIGKMLINLPKDTAEKLLDNLVHSDPVPEAEAKEYQNRILFAIHCLEARGKIAV